MTGRFDNHMLDTLQLYSTWFKWCWSVGWTCTVLDELLFFSVSSL